MAAELAGARRQAARGLADEEVAVGRVHERFTYRMHDLGEFMKGPLQRYTQWHNRRHSRTSGGGQIQALGRIKPPAAR